MSQRKCPDGEELRQYALGTLVEERDMALEAHLLTCPACETAIRSLDSVTDLDDPLLTALRKPATMRFEDFFADPAFAAAVDNTRALQPAGDAGGVDHSVPQAAGWPAAGPQSADQVLPLLVESGLVTADELDAALARQPSPALGADFQLVVERLVEAGKLTRFQAQAICQRNVQGLLLGNYILLDVISQGGMGRVYKARHKKMNRVVALKVLPPAGSVEMVRRFQREVEVAATLTHPNVVTAYDADEARGVHFLVMEFVDGKDLQTRVKQSGPLRVADAVDCILQAARGLDYAHRRGVVHRDIKPSNFLQDARGTVKILDMGLARIEDSVGAADNGLTQGGQVMGTVAYMSPEQALDAHRADARSDIYSLGCTLYYLLSGQPPYGGHTLTGQILLHRDQPIPSLRAVCPDAPASLDALLHKMLAKRPEERPQSMTEVIHNLEACQAAADAVETPPAWASGIAWDSSISDDGCPAGTATPAAAGLVPATPAADSRPLPPTQTARRSNPPRKFVALAGAGFAALLLSVLIATVRSREGTLVVEVNAADVTVQVFDAEGKVQINRQAGGDRLTLAIEPGTHQLRLEKDGVRVFAQDFTLAWGEKKTIRATLQPAVPAAAKAAVPAAETAASAARARAYQQMWANGLGAPLSQTNSIGMRFVLIPPGEFEMGSTDQEIAANVQARKKDAGDSWSCKLLLSEGPRHTVTISKPFYLAMYDVTQGEYQEVMGMNPSTFSGTGPHEPRFTPAPSPKEMATRATDAKKVAGKDTGRHPVDMISWEDATEFCRKLSALPKERSAQRAYRLPTEAEWEYACRAGSDTNWSFGNDEASLKAHAWFWDNAGGATHPVGQKKPNAWDLYDMHGNVWQWCVDWFADDYYRHSPASDPPGSPRGATHVLRGGAWDYSAVNCRSAFRFHHVPTVRFDCYGFRVLLIFSPRGVAASGS
jgi:formylglycine-generating enzyme required for sulfatase activity/serine/threonine protein kinase